MHASLLKIFATGDNGSYRACCQCIAVLAQGGEVVGQVCRLGNIVETYDLYIVGNGQLQLEAQPVQRAHGQHVGCTKQCIGPFSGAEQLLDCAEPAVIAGCGIQHRHWAEADFGEPVLRRALFS